MIDHLSSYTTHFDAARRFYVAAFAPLGFSVQHERVMVHDELLPNRRACAFGRGGKATFWVIEVKEAASPRHIAFVAENRKAVAAFYEAALAAGARDDGPPGLRPIYHEHYYGAFVLDPDANGVEAVCHRPE